MDASGCWNLDEGAATATIHSRYSCIMKLQMNKTAVWPY
jgi:hypothetical protein